MNNQYVFGQGSLLAKRTKILGSYKEGNEIIKSLEGKIFKAEGSRGGKVIGHTKSGKPIYGHYNHNEGNPHKNFTSEEHREAAQLHIDKRKKDIENYFNNKTKKKESESNEEFLERKKHQIESAIRGGDLNFLDKKRAENHLSQSEIKVKENSPKYNLEKSIDGDADEEQFDKSENQELKKAFEILGIQ